jgi:hypothetical protein
VRIVLLVALVGCGSDPDPTTAVSVETARSLCQPICERDVECSGNVLEDCLDGCSAGYGPWVRHDALVKIAQCAASLVCGSSDVICHNTIAPLAEHLEWQEACRAGLDCASTDDMRRLCEVEVVTDPLGHLMRLTGTDIIAELTECLVLETCPQRISCVGQVENDRGLGVP